ncbi:helix-turn-helix protein [Natranaerovirga hydrolytica]|uniref:Helix-turn-helix protein n=2 Tax=Natranaerovirga hydrolytica TaxID=680378 RepID=A0A4R1MIW6_9FIRM|nr:helix-turn-helix protein [Natranaerovirga hydrolytica]
MDSKKVGSFISELRKKKNMTQQELGNKLNVTNKAVSKWETGDGYPEITTIPALAEVLGVSTSELLNGEIKGKGMNDEKEVVKKFNINLKMINKLKEGNNTNRILFVITSAFLIGIFTCMLCDYLINKAFGWSLYPLGALLIIWLIIIPIFKLKKHRIIISFTVFALSVIPYLFLIEYIAGEKRWVMPLALPIAILSIIALYIVLYLFIYTQIRKLYVTAISFIIFGVGINIALGQIIGEFVNHQQNTSTFINVFLSIFIACIIVMFEYKRTRKSSE